MRYVIYYYRFLIFRESWPLGALWVVGIAYSHTTSATNIVR